MATMEFFPSTAGHELRIMSKSAGDLKLNWDPDNREEVAAARAAFDRAREKGMTFFRLTGNGEQGSRIRTFDPTAEKILGIMPVVGG